MTKHVLIVHKVADYERWRTIFEEAAPLRKAAGELRYHLLAAADDGNQIIHYSQWTTLEAARAFFESDRLVQIRKSAGVEAPQFHYLNLIEEREL